MQGRKLKEVREGVPCVCQNSRLEDAAGPEAMVGMSLARSRNSREGRYC